jgi:hypothetical protein
MSSRSGALWNADLPPEGVSEFVPPNGGWRRTPCTGRLAPPVKGKTVRCT